MKKITLILVIFIILLQLISEVNTQGPEPPCVPPPPPITTTFTPPPLPLVTVTKTVTVTMTASPPSPAMSPPVVGVIGGVITLASTSLVALGFFLVRRNKSKNKMTRGDAMPGNVISNPKDLQMMNRYGNSKPFPNPTINQRQEHTPDFEIDSVESDVIRNLRQELMNSIEQLKREMVQGSLNSNVVNKDIIDQMKQRILQDIEQELKQNLKKEIMSSFVNGSGGNSNN